MTQKGLPIPIPSAPLTPSQFADALRKGSGKAWLHLRDHGDAGVEDVLVNAVTHNLSFDRQSEGSRTDWLFDLLALLPDKSRYRRAIIEAFAIAEGDWDIDVLAGLLMRFADTGDADAGQVLRESFSRLAGEAFETVAYRFIQLDGLAALPAVAARFGADDGGWHADWVRSQAEEEFGAEAVAAILAASTDPHVIAFDHSTRRSEKTMREPRARERLDELLAKLDTAQTGRRPAVSGFTRGAGPEELMRVVDMIEAGHRHLAALLAVGGRTALPRRPSNLLDLAQLPDASIADAAIDALVHFPGPETLAVGRRLLDAGNWAAVQLLVAASAEELRALPARFAHLTDAEQIHWLGMNLLDLSRARGSIEPSLFAWMVEATPCSVCRHSAVERLAEAHAIPPDMIEALRHDCDEETRDLVAALPTPA